MGYLAKQGDITDQRIRQYFFDTVEEMSAINIEHCAPGSVVYIITTGDIYMLTNTKEWRLQ